MRLSLSNERERLCFASRPDCCGNANRGKHRLRCFVDTPVVLHLASVCEKEIGTFRTIHRTTTTKPNDEVYRGISFRNRNGSFDIIRCWIWRNISEDISGNSFTLQCRYCSRENTGFFNPAICHNQDTTTAESPSQLT